MLVNLVYYYLIFEINNNVKFNVNINDKKNQTSNKFKICRNNN